MGVAAPAADNESQSPGHVPPWLDGGTNPFMRK